MVHVGIRLAVLCALVSAGGVPAARAQGSGMGPDNGADPQSMSADSIAARAGHHRTFSSGHQGMSHEEMQRLRKKGGSGGGSN